MPENRTFHTLIDENSLDEALDASRIAPVVLFKHSIWCGQSARARTRLCDLNRASDPPVYELVIQDNRPLSDSIATRFGIRHESPQAIVIYNREAVTHRSHGDISAEGIRSISASRGFRGDE